jgi:hypothetical protein
MMDWKTYLNSWLIAQKAKLKPPGQLEAYNDKNEHQWPEVPARPTGMTWLFWLTKLGVCDITD